jgi:bifunctional DNA-binding transcriptional regulator/antitoxin component of YhaV-PrlF toxin-antitoxin module
VWVVGKVEELPIDERGRLQLTKEIREKLGIKPKGRVRARVEDHELIITAPLSREEFIAYMGGFIRGGKPPMDPLKLKEIWEKPRE